MSFRKYNEVVRSNYGLLSWAKAIHLYSLFSHSPEYTLFSNALRDTVYSQEHLKLIVYANLVGKQ